MVWPKVFQAGDISGRSDKGLCADAYAAWGNCHSGAELPKAFGQVMVDIAAQLGIPNAMECELDKWVVMEGGAA